MKAKTLLLTLFPILTIFPQWQNIWTSPNIPGEAITGYLNFQKTANGWLKRLYYLDSTKFYISSSPTSLSPEYIYYFTPEEKLAGYQLYSIQTDLTSDGITEFYVLGYVGTSTNYRQTVKIFDITNNGIVFQGNQNGYSYSFPTFIDINSDGLLDCVFLKYRYPYDNLYFYEIYSTGVTPIDEPIEPIGYNLNQNYPNPFNGETNISFSINIGADVKLKIYDLKGEELTTLVNEFKPAGNHSVRWDGTIENKRVATGIYLYELIIDGKSSVKKMIYLK